jgi:hypothetical protein
MFQNKFQHKFFAKQNIHKIRAVDSKNGRPALYFVDVQPHLQQEFTKATELTKKHGSMNLEDYGTIIGSCYGEEPNDKLKALLKNKYGLDIDFDVGRDVDL